MTESIQKEDWARFRALGSVPPSIREVVLRSWVRSRGVRHLESAERAPAVAQEALHSIRVRNTRLRNAAEMAMKRAGYMLAESEVMVLLCDREGVVMEAGGDRRVLDRGIENQLQPGGRWGEEGIGTNAIGTALRVGAPVVIDGVEHYCEAIQRWACAAAPIRHPASGDVLGAIDLSGPSGSAFAKIGVLSATLGMQIEEALRAAMLDEHRRLVEQVLARRGRSGTDELLLLDSEGRKVWESADFGRRAQDVGGLDGAALLQMARQAGEDGAGVVMRLRTVLPEAEIDLLHEGSAQIGALVTLPSPRRRPRRVAGRDDVALERIAAGGPEMAALCETGARLVAHGLSFGIEGPVGSGKETLARALHGAGPLAGRPFRLVDCALLTAEALRLDLGTRRGYLGLGESGGTLCLDELCQIPEDLQPLLARLLADLAHPEHEPVQVIAVSVAPLAGQMARGRLRPELQQCAASSVLMLPGLAQRREEIPALLRALAERERVTRQGRALRFTPAALERLCAYDWPGNLRELSNLVRVKSVTSLNHLIDVADLPPEIARAGTGPAQGDVSGDTLRDREKLGIVRAMEESGGNLSVTARRLGISRSTLYLKLDQYGLPRARQR